MGSETREYCIKVMGRTLEHLGIQMYKHRDAAIAELVANSWDAGAENVDVTVPRADDYDINTSEIVLKDDGAGMDPDEVQSLYLVVGRNRRSDAEPPTGRAVMGRKGIGKLAGFGISNKMKVLTWRDGRKTEFTLDSEELKTQAGQVNDVSIKGVVRDVDAGEYSKSGTELTLTDLRAKTPIDVPGLIEALARRFSRRVRGEMQIRVNGELVGEPTVDFEHREPPTDGGDGFIESELADGQVVRWWAGFSKTVLRSKELRGFTIQVRGKTAQAPDFFFDVESTASGQHGIRYLTGVIEADYLDEGVEDETDLISTDRQQIDWEDSRTASLYAFGQELTRRLLREHAERGEKVVQESVFDNPELSSRISALDATSQAHVRAVVGRLGRGGISVERALELADVVVRAYEYRQFHDYIEQFDAIGDDPDRLAELLEHLQQWKVLEGRAVLEVVKGRLDIIEKFHRMITENYPETAPVGGAENIHDLIADYPWLLDPDWQVLAEERTISRQLADWADEDIDQLDRSRYDFLALQDEARFIVVEIKRPGHAPTLEDLQQLERYKDKLAGAHANRNVSMVLIAGQGHSLNEQTWRSWQERDDARILTWADVYERSLGHYEHYRAVLEGNIRHPDFDRGAREVTRTREVLERGAYRGPARRARGIGPGDGAPTVGTEVPRSGEAGPSGASADGDATDVLDIEPGQEEAPK